MHLYSPSYNLSLLINYYVTSFVTPFLEVIAYIMALWYAVLYFQLADIQKYE